MKNLLFPAVLLFFGICHAQVLERREIKGTITVPSGFDAEGITIYNQTSYRGTVSSERGNFSLRMAVADTLVFSAVHFRELTVVIDRQVMESGVLNVEIYEGINELPEITIRPHKLTGNLEEDLKQAEIVELDVTSITYEGIKDLNYVPDSQTSPRNVAMESYQTAQTPIDLLKVAGLIAGWILPKKKPAPKVAKRTYTFIDRELRSRYSEEFFKSTLGISAEGINDFISFAQENGLDHHLMEKENEIDLLALLIEQSTRYRTRE